MRKSVSLIAFSLSAALLAAPAAGVVGPSGDAAAFSDRVVMVLTRGPQGSGLCSGVVLAPRIVLTAAHCLRPPSDMRIHFRDSLGQPIVQEVSAALAHPDYHPDAAARRVRSLDLGLIETKEALPGAFRPAALAEGEPPAPGSPVTVVGFGVEREGDWKSGGRLGSAKLRVRDPRSRVLLWTTPEDGDAGACSGDSGGPIFDAEEKTVVAIVAWTEGRGGAKCGQLTQGILVAPLADWIRAAMARFAGQNATESGR